MDIRSVDLNLLAVFDAMFRHRQVTRAAADLDLSQPAMSAALARLRALFDDPLFVRSAARMSPTPRAELLAPTVRRIIDMVEGDLLRPSLFDPLTSNRTFTLVTPDIAETYFLPSILTELARIAPGVSLKTLAMPRQTAAEALESGAADLALGYFPDLKKAGFYHQKILQNGHACVVRKDHPIVGERITLAQFLKLNHAVVKPDGREHVFEQFLRKKGIQRRVVVELCHFMSLVSVLEVTDLVATIPEDLAAFFAGRGNVRFVPTPMKSPVIDVHLFWHERFQKEKAHAWMRALIFRVLHR